MDNLVVGEDLNQKRSEPSPSSSWVQPPPSLSPEPLPRLSGRVRHSRRGGASPPQSPPIQPSSPSPPQRRNRSPPPQPRHFNCDRERSTRQYPRSQPPASLLKQSRSGGAWERQRRRYDADMMATTAQWVASTSPVPEAEPSGSAVAKYRSSAGGAKGKSEVPNERLFHIMPHVRAPQHDSRQRPSRTGLREGESDDEIWDGSVRQPSPLERGTRGRPDRRTRGSCADSGMEMPHGRPRTRPDRAHLGPRRERRERGSRSRDRSSRERSSHDRSTRFERRSGGIGPQISSRTLERAPTGLSDQEIEIEGRKRRDWEMVGELEFGRNRGQLPKSSPASPRGVGTSPRSAEGLDRRLAILEVQQMELAKKQSLIELVGKPADAVERRDVEAVPVPQHAHRMTPAHVHGQLYGQIIPPAPPTYPMAGGPPQLIRLPVSVPHTPGTATVEHPPSHTTSPPTSVLGGTQQHVPGPSVVPQYVVVQQPGSVQQIGQAQSSQSGMYGLPQMLVTASPPLMGPGGYVMPSGIAAPHMYSVHYGTWAQGQPPPPNTSTAGTSLAATFHTINAAPQHPPTSSYQQQQAQPTTRQRQTPRRVGTGDVDGGEWLIYALPFADYWVRQKYSRNVLLLLLGTLVATCCIEAACMFLLPIADAMKSQPSIIAFLIPLLVLIMVLFAYREKPRLRTPANGFYLAFLVGLLAVVLGYATVIWEIPALFQLSYLLTVFMACSTLTVGTTVLPVGNIWAVLFSLAVMLLTAIITGYAAYKDVIPQLVFACIGALLVAFLFLLDVHLLMTERAFQIGREDVVFGVITMYVDWVNLIRYTCSVCCMGKEGA